MLKIVSKIGDAMSRFAFDQRGYLAVAAALLMVASADVVLAGTAGTEFTAAWTTLSGWAEGFLGRIIAASMIIVGLAMGVARQSVMAFVPGLAAGFGLFLLPGIMTNVVAATL